MSTIKVDTIQNTSGVESYTARAWVNFNGKGTVAIRESGNVSSITDNGTGVYSTNFASSLPTSTYSFMGTLGNQGTASMRTFILQTTTNEGATASLMTTSAVRAEASNGSSKYDAGIVCVHII